MLRTGRSIPPHIALVLLYATSGLIWGTWIARIPTITSELELTRSQIGMVLPAFPAGALVAFPLVAAVTTRFGSGRATMTFGLMRAAVFPLLGLAPDMLTLMLALGISGFAHGGLEVSLNSQGVEIEHQTRRPILARGAAASSIGTLVSTIGVWLYSRTELPSETPFLYPALVGIAMFWYFGHYLIPDERILPEPASTHRATTARWHRWFPPAALLAVLAFAFITELADEAISEWEAIYLEHDLGTGPAISSLNFSIYTTTLLIGRLFGDTIARYVPPTRILQAGGIIGGLGVMVGVGLGTPTSVLIGTGITGLGTSLLLPTIYRLAGSTPGIPKSRALAIVATTIYTGFIIGPLVIGPISSITTLGAALTGVGILYFGIPLLVSISRGTRFAPAELPEHTPVTTEAHSPEPASQTAASRS